MDESKLADETAIEEKQNELFYSMYCKNVSITPNAFIKEKIEIEMEKQPSLCDLVLNGNSLELFNHRLTSRDIKILVASLLEPAAVDVLSALKTIDLSYNAIDDEGCEALTELLLSSNCNVCSLILGNNDIGPKGATMIADSLIMATSVTKVDLSCNPIEAEGGIAFSTVLRENSTIQSLNIGNTSQDITSIISLCHTLTEYNETLVCLNLDQPINNGLGEEIVGHISEMLQVNKTLIELSLAKHKIRDDGVSLLCDALAFNGVVKSLDLRCNQITMGGAKAFSQLMINTDNILSINLDSNKIKDEGVYYISQALLHNSSLLQLNIRNNGLTGRGLVFIGDALQHNQSITDIEVWGNEFDADAAMLFYGLLQSKQMAVRSFRTDIYAYADDSGEAFVAEL